MKAQQFYTQLGIVSALMAILLMGLNQYDLFAAHQTFSWATCFAFILFCVGLYHISVKTVHSNNKNLFGQVFLLSIFFKILLCATMVIVYALVKRPEKVHFIIPFLLTYLCYTIYEVYFVTKLAKSDLN